MEKKKIGGLIVPTFTVFNKDESIDYEGTKAYIEFILENGANALLSLGTTQENVVLTDEEYKKLVREIVEFVNGRVPVLIGATTPSTRQSVEYARYAASVGADAVFSAAPYAMTLQPGEILDYHRDVAASVDIPYLLYNNPFLSKTGLSVQEIAQLTHEGVVTMIKDTTSDPVRMLDLILACKEGTGVFFGDDYGAFQALIVGSSGWNSGIANILPKECKELWKLAAEDQNAKDDLELWKKLLPLYYLTMSPYWLQVYKKGVGVRIGTSDLCRKPLFPLPEETGKQVEDIVRQFGY